MFRVALLVLAVNALQAQSLKYPVSAVPVERNGIKFTNAWTGGLNAPEFSSIDLDGDGRNDLFVFDKAGDKVLTFLNDGGPGDTAYHYAPAYEKLFPPLSVWAVVRDYNQDGIPDIFTAQTGEVVQGSAIPPGIKVYKGSRVNGNLKFSVVQYCLYYTDGGTKTNLWVNGLGIPGLIDVNGDGDLDVLTFDLFGTDIEYYENQTVEQGLPADSLAFDFTSGCWGNVYVGTSGITPTLGISCKANNSNESGGPRHGGATLWPLDNQHDGDVDVLISESHSNYMVLLNNTGNSGNANIGWADTLWPTCSAAARMPYFPAAFNLDVNNDGEKDMLIAPNFTGQAMDAHNVLFYPYVNGDSCAYHFSGSDSFLVHTMLDFGTDSKCVFYNYNDDSLMDILVGNYYLYNPLVAAPSKVGLYQNVGTTTAPSFKLITDDFAGLSAYYNGASTLAVTPAFGDLDGDGNADMLTGNANGDLNFFKGTGLGLNAFPAMTQPLFDSLHVNGYSSPFIYDFNGDSLNDIVVGRKDGRLSYYWNYGTPTSPLFYRDSVNANFGLVNVTAPSSSDGYSYPSVHTDSAGNMILVVGSERGRVLEYLIDSTKLRAGAFQLIDSNALGYDAGSRVTVQCYDLNEDGRVEYLLGNSRGGLQLFSETVWDSSAILALNKINEPYVAVSLFPNPAKEQITCLFKDGKLPSDLCYAIYNLQGQRLALPFVKSADRLVFDTGSLTSGLYLVYLRYSGGFQTLRFVVNN